MGGDGGYCKVGGGIYCKKRQHPTGVLLEREVGVKRAFTVIILLPGCRNLNQNTEKQIGIVCAKFLINCLFITTLKVSDIKNAPKRTCNCYVIIFGLAADLYN